MDAVISSNQLKQNYVRKTEPVDQRAISFIQNSSVRV